MTLLDLITHTAGNQLVRIKRPDGDIYGAAAILRITIRERGIEGAEVDRIKANAKDYGTMYTQGELEVTLCD